jgi:hypothetical protein
MPQQAGSQVSNIRAVMVTMPAMLRDLLDGLTAGRIVLDVVAELPTRQALLQRLAVIGPDLIVIGLRRNESDAVIRRLLSQLPDARVIAFWANGRAVAGFELRLYRVDLGHAPPETLVEFICENGGHHGHPRRPSRGQI